MKDEISKSFSRLRIEAKEFGINISKEDVATCTEFAKILIESNKKTNLTRLTSAESCMIGMFLDSLLFLRHIDRTKNFSILDIGTGAGFPAMVLAITGDLFRITAIDSRHKKTDFISLAAEQLELTNIRAIHSRAEELESDGFDCVVARAVGSLSKTIRLGLPHLKEKGKMVIACSEKSFSKKPESQFKVKLSSSPYLLPGYNNTFTHVLVNKR